MTFRKSLTALAVLAALIFSVAGITGANAQPVNRPSRVCSEKAKENSHVTPGWSEAQFTANSCNWQLRVKIACTHSGVPTKFAYSGWIRPLNKWTRANCPSPYVLNTAWTQVRSNPGQPVTTKKYYPST